MNAAPSILPADTGTEHDEFLRTDAVQADLDRRTARGGTISLIANAIAWVMNVGGTMVLARLLLPSDFGLLAMVTVVTGLVANFTDFGFSTATIQRANLAQPQVSGLFWLNLRITLVITALLAAFAPLLAWFYGEPGLIGITLVLSVGTLAMGLSMLQLGLLRRQMRFGVVVCIDVTAVAVSVIAGIALAWAGAGYWALVAQQVLLQLIQATGLWMCCRWRPLRPSRSAKSNDPELRALLSFGSYATAGKLVNYIGRQIDAVLVGRLIGAGALGLYSKAYVWAMMPFHQMYFPLMGVAVSSLSRLQDDPGRYRHYIRTALLGIFAASFGGMAMLFIKAEDGLLVLLGGQWVDAIPLFRVLVVGAVAMCIAHVTRWIYLAEGRTQRGLVWSLISSTVMIAGAAIGTIWGALGVALGVATAAWVLVYPALAFCLKGSSIRMRDIGSAVWRPILVSLLASAGLMGFEWLVPIEWRIVRLVVAGVVFAILYGGLWLALPGGWAAAKGLLTAAGRAR